MDDSCKLGMCCIIDGRFQQYNAENHGSPVDTTLTSVTPLTPVTARRDYATLLTALCSVAMTL